MEIDWITFVAEIINLFVLIWLLKRFLYRPVIDIINQRQNEINEKFEAANALHHQAESEFQTLEIEKNAFEQSQQNRQNDLTKEMTLRRQESLKSIQKEAAQLQQQLKIDIQSQKETLKIELERFISQDFISIAGKIITDLTGATPMERVLNLFYERLIKLSKTEKNKIDKIIRNQKVIFINSSNNLTEKHHRDMNRFLRQYFNISPKTKIQYQVQPELLLGIEIRFQDTSIDWTIKNYLDELQQGLDKALNHTGE